MTQQLVFKPNTSPLNKLINDEIQHIRKRVDLIEIGKDLVNKNPSTSLNRNDEREICYACGVVRGAISSFRFCLLLSSAGNEDKDIYQNELEILRILDDRIVELSKFFNITST